MRPVEISGKGQVTVAFYPEYYEKPFKEGYYIEAIAIIDAMIDEQLRVFAGTSGGAKLYSENGKVRLGGDHFLKILEGRKLVDPETANKIRKFKEKRNLITHNPEGEYLLLLEEQRYYEKFTNQEEVDREVKRRVGELFSNGLGLFTKINQIDMQYMDKQNKRSLRVELIDNRKTKNDDIKTQKMGRFHEIKGETNE